MTIIEAAKAIKEGKVVFSDTYGKRLRMGGRGPDEDLICVALTVDGEELAGNWAPFTTADLLATDYEVVE